MSVVKGYTTEITTIALQTADSIVYQKIEFFVVTATRTPNTINFTTYTHHTHIHFFHALIFLRSVELLNAQGGYFHSLTFCFLLSKK
jgi:hypothetical protein